MRYRLNTFGKSPFLGDGAKESESCPLAVMRCSGPILCISVPSPAISHFPQGTLVAFGRKW